MATWNVAEINHDNFDTDTNIAGRNTRSLISSVTPCFYSKCIIPASVCNTPAYPVQAKEAFDETKQQRRDTMGDTYDCGHRSDSGEPCNGWHHA